MNAITLQRPIPPAGLTVRPGTRDDLPFVDRLQKSHGRALGFLHAATLEGKVRLGHVLVAEAGGRAAGYVIGNDRYFKRDDVGAVFQLVIAPEHRRGLVGATLLASLFDRWAWGCKLACCWCAQDLAEASAFWAAMGFAPIAFRGGSSRKGRVHIFWQRRLRAGDGATPYWYPAVTGGGAMNADRVVLPIPRGTHWSAVTRPTLPGDGESGGPRALPSPRRPRTPAVKAARPAFPPPHLISSGGLRFAPFAPPTPEVPAVVEKPVKAERAKVSPALLALAREMRDRWQGKVEGGEWAIESGGKYDVSRALPASDAPPLLTGPPIARRVTGDGRLGAREGVGRRGAFVAADQRSAVRPRSSSGTRRGRRGTGSAREAPGLRIVDPQLRTRAARRRPHSRTPALPATAGPTSPRCRWRGSPSRRASGGCRRG